MPDVSDAQPYIDGLATLYGAISFGGAPLSAVTSPPLINKFMKSIMPLPETTINVYTSPISTDRVETKQNRRTWTIITSIWTLAEDRELKAQRDNDYLTQEVLSVAEQNLSNTFWTDGILKNDSIQATALRVVENHYVRDVPLTFIQRVTTAN